MLKRHLSGHILDTIILLVILLHVYSSIVYNRKMMEFVSPPHFEK